MTKASQDPGYPQSPIAVVDQALYPLKVIEETLITRVKLFQSCEFLTDDKLPMCNNEERWQKKDKYALMKTGRKSAIKLCDSMDEANVLLSQKHKGGDSIVFRRGESIRCKSYCDVREFCSFYKETMAGNESINSDEE
jgi:hypothetical protein